ncbi:hypothetical protein ACN47E_005148 [Coniothyrium glycines]
MPLFFYAPFLMPSLACNFLFVSENSTFCTQLPNFARGTYGQYELLSCMNTDQATELGDTTVRESYHRKVSPVFMQSHRQPPSQLMEKSVFIDTRQLMLAVSSDSSKC